MEVLTLKVLGYYNPVYFVEGDYHTQRHSVYQSGQGVDTALKHSV